METKDILKEIEGIVDSKDERNRPKSDAPMAKMDEIQKNRTPAGKGEMIIGGIPWDVHSLESYILKVSPLEMKTLLRYSAIRNVELVLNNQRPKDMAKNEFDYWSIIIWIIVIIAIVGFFIFFGPKILGALGDFSGGLF